MILCQGKAIRHFFSCLEKAEPSSQETWLHSLGYYSSFFQAQSSIFDDLSSAFWQGNEILCGLFFSVKTFTRGGAQWWIWSQKRS